MSLTKVSYSMITGAAINILDYGCVGDNSTDNLVAFQKAINVAGDTGIKRVYVPAGTYILQLTSGINIVDSAGNAINGFEIFGAGDASVLKVGINSAKNYEAILGSILYIENVYVHDIAFDFNTARAATRIGAERFHNPAIMLTRGGLNIQVENCSFLNASVDQPVRLANLTAPHVKVNQVSFDNCRWYVFSDGVAGNNQADISCIYAFVNDMRISNCSWYSGLTSMAGVSSKGITAIECYGKWVSIDGNTFRFVNRAHIIGSVNNVLESDDVLITNNVYNNCVCLVDSQTRSETQGSITFIGNKASWNANAPLSLPQFLDLNFTSGTQPSKQNSLSIKSNHFEFTNATAATTGGSGSYSHLVESSTTELIEFTGNTVTGHPSGIFHTEFFDVAKTKMTLVFKGNTLRNIRTDAAKAGRGGAPFFLEASAIDLNSVTFEENYVENYCVKANRAGTGYDGPLVAVIFNATGENLIVANNTVLGANIPIRTDSPQPTFTSTVTTGNLAGTQTD